MPAITKHFSLHITFMFDLQSEVFLTFSTFWMSLWGKINMYFPACFLLLNKTLVCCTDSVHQSRCHWYLLYTSISQEQAQKDLEWSQLPFVCIWIPFRDRANLQVSNRRLERKVKELVLQVDDEHLSLTDQKDQVEGRSYIYCYCYYLDVYFALSKRLRAVYDK